ncbi:MAG: hypothetical protein M0R80_13555 [Proteobacteria bacterium]|jgi:hypothetical protein|nr:hypothetical protein [Pseudomonadota bacterium]
MEESKQWYESKGVLSSLVIIAASVAGMAGYVIDEKAQAEIVEFVFMAVTAIGGAISLYGRIKATKVIRTAKGE